MASMPPAPFAWAFAASLPPHHCIEISLRAARLANEIGQLLSNLGP